VVSAREERSSPSAVFGCFKHPNYQPTRKLTSSSYPIIDNMKEEQVTHKNEKNGRCQLSNE